METHPKTKLLRQIETSTLLSPENREKLCAYLPLLSDEQVADLSVALSKEEDAMQGMATEALTEAAERGDAENIQNFATFLHSATHDLSTALEKSDADDVEHIFDKQS